MIVGDNRQLIRLGETQNWAKTHADQLANAIEIRLIAKANVNLPTVRVQLNPERKWVFFSRVYGASRDGVQAPLRRHYAIGYQDKGSKNTSLVWIDPDGLVSLYE